MFTDNKTDLKDFFGKRGAANFQVDKISELTLIIDEYQKTITSCGGAFDRLLTDIEADISQARAMVSEYTRLDEAYHREEILKGS